jgi:hypothetical protein
MLIQGNMLEAHAHKVMEKVTSIVEYRQLIPNTWPQVDIFKSVQCEW